MICFKFWPKISLSILDIRFFVEWVKNSRRPGCSFIPSKLSNESGDYERCFLRTGLNALMALSISMVLVPYSVGFFVPSIFEAFSCKFSKNFKLQQIDFHVSSEGTVPLGKYCLIALFFSSNIKSRSWPFDLSPLTVKDAF